MSYWKRGREYMNEEEYMNYLDEKRQYELDAAEEEIERVREEEEEDDLEIEEDLDEEEEEEDEE
jgi:hypothetical protein